MTERETRDACARIADRFEREHTDLLHKNSAAGEQLRALIHAAKATTAAAIARAIREGGE